MPITFGGAVSVAAPAIFDTDASQATGASMTGIGLTNDDGDNIVDFPDQRIGGAAAVHEFDTDGNAATPAPAPSPPPPP